MNARSKVGLAIVSATMMSAPLNAEGTASSAPAIATNKAGDAGEIVCEKIPMIGSRLATKKICMTRSQWAETKRQDRQAVEKAQASPCVIQTTGAGGRPSC
jgi:hypothetical protein